MDRPSRLPVDCPRCENRGVLALDDDWMLPCPLCNNWCTLCLEDVPPFVQITRPYRGSLIAGMRPSADLQDYSNTLLFYLEEEDVDMKLGPGEPSAAPWRVVPVRDFVRLVLDSRAHDRPWILAVDGRGGNGKSTIADLLHHAVPSSLVVHTDDIAWHHSFFDWGDLLIENILKPLHSGKAVRYQPPGWQTHGRTGAIAIAAGLTLVIVEGVGASRTEAMPWIDRSIWVQSDLDEAKRRCLAREGNTEEARKFWDEWMIQELDFLQRQRPWERATAIVNNTPTQPYDRSSQIVASAASPCFTPTTIAGS